MKLLWLISLIFGVCAFVAAVAYRRFARGQAGDVVPGRGRGGVTKVFILLGVLFVSLGLLAGWRGHWELIERPQFAYVVTALLPENAKVVADAVDTPLDRVFGRIPGVEQIVSESRGDGTCLSRIVFSGKQVDSNARYLVECGIIDAQLFLPRNVTRLFWKREAAEAKGDDVAIAILSKETGKDGTVLREFARSVLKRLNDEHALLNPRPLDEQFSDHGAPPALVVHVNLWPAIRIAGSAPAGKSTKQAVEQCVVLAEAERKNRPDGEDFQIVKLAR